MKYSNELKIQAVNDYINGIKLKDIAIKYNIKDNSSILDWYQKYHESSDIKVFDRKKRNKTNEVRLKNKVNKYSEENKKLKKWLFELEEQIKRSAYLIELKKEKKKREQTEKEVELLKKSIASFLIGYQKVNKKTYTKKDINQIYQTVYELSLMGNDAKQTILIYGVGYRSYTNWIKRGKPECKRQYHLHDKEAVESIYSRKDGIFGAEKARLKILKDFNINLSRETIIELRTDVLLKLKKEIAYSKSKTRMGISTHKKYTSLDLIKGDYNSNKYLEKIGIDGTWFKNIYIGGVKTKRLFLPAYDFYSNEISSYSVGNSENILVTLEMLEGLVRKMDLVRIKKIIMHSDLGSAFTSKETEKFCKQHNIIRSNSASGFKGNQFVEQTHRWVKKYFYLIFGNKFNNDQHFRSCIYKFVKIFNSTNIILKNGCTPNEMIQNFSK